LLSVSLLAVVSQKVTASTFAGSLVHAAAQCSSSSSASVAVLQTVTASTRFASSLVHVAAPYYSLEACSRSKLLSDRGTCIQNNANCAICGTMK
jgi:hypothetical protein